MPEKASLLNLKPVSETPGIARIIAAVISKAGSVPQELPSHS